MTRKFLFSAMKDEAPFILEWLAYHKAVGFTDIVIAANESNDNTIEILTALDAHGEITFLQNDVDVGAKPQGEASKLFTKNHAWSDGDWGIWLDADEFLNVHIGQGSVDCLIDFLDAEKRDGLFVSWRLFGDNGLEGLPANGIIRSFQMACTKRSSRHWKELKTFFKFSPSIRGFCYNTPNRPKIRSGVGSPDFLLGVGRAFDPNWGGHKRWLSGEDFGAACKHEKDGYGWKLAQINHYAVRTRDLFDLKRIRGRGAGKVQADGQSHRHTDELFERLNTNTVREETISRHFDHTMSEINRLAALEGVGALHQEAIRITQERIDSLRAET